MRLRTAQPMATSVCCLRSGRSLRNRQQVIVSRGHGIENILFYTSPAARVDFTADAEAFYLA
jgi:hypothetical protein